MSEQHNTSNEALTRRNSDTIMHERIKAVEVKQDIIYTTLKDHIDDEAADKDAILTEIRQVKATQDKQKGFIAGISAAVSAIVIAIGMALKWFQS